VSADKRRGRGLSADERALWSGVTRSVEPLGRRRRQAARPEIAADAGPAAPATAAPAKSNAQRARPGSAAPPARPAAAPPLAPLGRRLKQSVARGRAQIDARVDLHGLTQREAHHVLLRFLRRAQADGAKIALVVTGKGGGAGGGFAGERGVLRRQVPLWLALPEFRDFIVGFETAGAGHGGEGALYVRLRRKRQSP
jgi:DNA-nicking Smr family endonuclease